jgi:hypothetical protein
MLSGVWAWVCSLGPVRWLLPLLPTWLVVEVAFFVYLRYIVLPSLNNLTEPEPASDADSPWEQFHKIIDLVTDLGDKYRFEKFFSGWFQGADIKDIHKGNVQEMLGWAFFSKDYAECSVAEKERIENVLIWLKMRFRVDAPDGKNPNVQAIRLTLEKVHYVHRPLVFYVFLTGAQLVGHAVLRLMGFRRHEVNGIAYWYRNQAPSARNATTAKASAAARGRDGVDDSLAPSLTDTNTQGLGLEGTGGGPDPLPMVFFHGISPGLNMYLGMVHYLTRGRKAVLVEVPHIAMCLNFKAKPIQAMVKAVS